MVFYAKITPCEGSVFQKNGIRRVSRILYRVMNFCFFEKNNSISVPMQVFC